MAETLGFRPITAPDLDLVRTWLADPEVGAWWDEADEVFQSVLGPGDPEVSPWLLLVDDRPVGFVQHYEVARWPESFPGVTIPPGTVGVDISIGEPDARDRGLGRRMLVAFIDQVIRRDVPGCREVWIDPDPRNARAHRSYLAAGFVDTGIDLPDDHNPEATRRLMRLVLPMGAGSSALSSVAVYCGSSPGHDPGFAAAAADLGRQIADRGIRLVYGGGHVGLMGVVADAALAAGGEVTGVITRHLMDHEVGHLGLTELVVVETMHQRKLAMSDRADAFIALPGGLGTMEELFEVVTWTQLDLHQKAVGLYDVDGYFRHLLAFLDGGVDAGFIKPRHRALLLVADTPSGVLDQLAAWSPSPDAKWVTPDLR